MTSGCHVPASFLICGLPLAYHGHPLLANFWWVSIYNAGSSLCNWSLEITVLTNWCYKKLLSNWTFFFFFLNEAGFTQGDFLSRVSRQEEDKQGQSRDQDAWDEKIEAIVERPSAHHHGEGDVRVRFLTTAVEMLIPLSWNLWFKTRHTFTVVRRVTESWRERLEQNIFNDFTDNLTYQQDPTLRWQCNCWYLHPSPLSPETNLRMSRNQTSGHIFGHQTGTNAHRCGRCSWKSLLWWETLKDAERLAFIHIVLHL